MMRQILALPFFVILMGIAALSMLLPGAHAAAVEDFPTMRAFIQSSFLFLILTALIGLATGNYSSNRHARSHLLALLGTFIALPVMLAVPFHEAVPNTTFLNTYVEMVSSLTTTGATLFDAERLPDSVHLWRAFVGWMGGFFVWVTAIAILAPMNLGGFEVLAPAATGRGAARSADVVYSSDTSVRLQRYAKRLFPIYAGLTLVLWIALLLSGDTPLVSFCHAMSTIATSGISPIGGLEVANSGRTGEFVILFFLIFAISRQTFSFDQPGSGVRRLLEDPEFRIGVLLALTVPLLLFLRHWVGAFEVNEEANVTSGLHALWGSFFTVISFMTTTGFASESWAASHTWSGLATPGIILMGLALIGGGVATTAGGVKLLRVYALYKHGMREMDRLVHPSSVGGAGTVARRLRRQGAYVAWVAFMLFAMTLAIITLAFAYTGLDFSSATTLAVAALTTTGPIATIAAQTPISYGDLPTAAKAILSVAMVLGRLETLAIIALLNPDFWRS